MNIYQSLSILITISLASIAHADTNITTTNDDNTSTILSIPDVGPDRITTVITPSVLSSSTVTTKNSDGTTSSKTVTEPITPGVDTPSETTITGQDE